MLDILNQEKNDWVDKGNWTSCTLALYFVLGSQIGREAVGWKDTETSRSARKWSFARIDLHFISDASIQASLQDRLNSLPTGADHHSTAAPTVAAAVSSSSSATSSPRLAPTAPDLSGFVTWDRLEDALRGIRESIAKSSHDAAAALASVQTNRPAVQLIERQSQTVRQTSSSLSSTIDWFLF